MSTLHFNYADADAPLSPAALALVLTAHALAVWVLATQHQKLPDVLEQPIIVSLVAPEAPVQPQIEPPKVIPTVPKPVKKVVERAPQPMPTPEIAKPVEQLVAQAPASNPAPAVEAAPPQEAPPPPQAAKVEAEPVAEPIEQPRFNADYLNNPAPGYPPLSRRLREEGTVLLRVRVDTEGRAAEVTLRESSGHGRLDERALDTVKRWKFIPAKQGGQPVEAWVIVPIQFSLKG